VGCPIRRLVQWSQRELRAVATVEWRGHLHSGGKMELDVLTHPVGVKGKGAYMLSHFGGVRLCVNLCEL